MRWVGKLPKWLRRRVGIGGFWGANWNLLEMRRLSECGQIFILIWRWGPESIWHRKYSQFLFRYKNDIKRLVFEREKIKKWENRSWSVKRLFLDR